MHEKSETETEVCLKSMHQSQCNCNAATNHHFIDHHSQQILILPTRPVAGSFITGAYNAWRQCFTLWTSKFWTISYCISYGQGFYLLYTLLCQYFLWTIFIDIYSSDEWFPSLCSFILFSHNRLQISGSNFKDQQRPGPPSWNQAWCQYPRHLQPRHIRPQPGIQILDLKLL